jgi:hypothetical protein
MSYVCSQMKLAHTYTRRERPFECMLGRERERERERESVNGPERRVGE